MQYILQFDFSHATHFNTCDTRQYGAYCVPLTPLSSSWRRRCKNWTAVR